MAILKKEIFFAKLVMLLIEQYAQFKALLFLNQSYTFSDKMIYMVN